MSFNPVLYTHELDQKAFDALNAFPKFVKLRETYIANVDEKAAKIRFLSSAIRLSDRQLPEIYQLLPPICEKLGIAIPELYYVKAKCMNAATCGSTNPYIYVTSELVEKIPTDLIATVLAHECGHIACRHYLYHSMAGQLIDGIDSSPLSKIPAISRYLTPALVRALLFWDRCSELSADRAAALCDGTSDKTIDLLLRLYGYENVDRAEFLQQALDLKAFVNDSKSNKLMELMLTQDDSHPGMATRAYESYEWTKTEQFRGILDGTYTSEKKDAEGQTQEQEIVAAELTVKKEGAAPVTDIDAINHTLAEVNDKLERYTNHADKADYAFAICSGMMAGAVDALFVGEITIKDGDIALSHQQVNHFIQEYAGARGFPRDRLQDAIRDLEKEFRVPQDNVWKGAGIGVAAKNHHLADLAHHPTPLGLVSSIIAQILRAGIFVNREGEWHFLPVKTDTKDIVEILVPAVITGILNWLVFIAAKAYEQTESEEMPEALRKLARLVASTPMILKLAKCADNWFGHLVSDMGGAKNTAGGGMGIPGVFLSLLYEFAALPVLKDTGLPLLVDELYEKQRFDLRHEIPFYKAAGKQTVPVVFNELIVRVGYFVSHLAAELAKHGGDAAKINWNSVIPLRNRTVGRMLAVANMTFTVADTADAAIHAAIASGGNWVLFSGHFVTRFNYLGAGRAAVAVVKEISNERRETQLIHEKMLLSEAKTAVFFSQLQQFKAQLEEKVSRYIAEDIEAFMCGFDDMNEGIASGDADRIIKGNVVIQRVLGRAPQFTNQKEFDDLMEEDIPVIL